MKLKILVGTMTSTADYVAQAIQMDCADLVSEIEIELMDNLDISVFDAVKAEDALYLICSSTYGSGDVPDNARALYESLGANPQFLGHVRYGVIALGDRTYMQTFCFGGKKFDERLQDLGAQRIGESGAMTRAAAPCRKQKAPSGAANGSPVPCRHGSQFRHRLSARRKNDPVALDERAQAATKTTEIWRQACKQAAQTTRPARPW
jgi:MioC protein